MNSGQADAPQVTTEPLPEAFLVREHEYFSESFWRNEEVGEKRVNFFVTLLTAVLGGLTALATSEHRPEKNDFKLLCVYALLGLLLFGWATLNRMIKRKKVSDEYKNALDAIRELYRQAHASQLGRYRPLNTPPRSTEKTGGYIETVIVMNNFIAATLCGLIASFLGEAWLTILLGLAGFWLARKVQCR